MLPVGCKMQLNTVQMCAKWVRPDKESNNLTTVLSRITKACRDIYADIVKSHAGYGVTSCFRSVFMEVRKMAKNAASGKY